MRWIRGHWWQLLLVAFGGFLLIQLVPYRVTNPSARDEPKWDSAQTRALAVKACYDCHSNETKVLPFEKVAPIAWYINNHVEEGRAALNFSEWHTKAGYSDEIAGAVRDGMPPAYYHYFGLHKDAKLTAAQVDALVKGLKATIAADPPKRSGGGG